MTSGFFTGDFLRGLTFRVLFFLSLALLPLGLIAISQTRQIAEQNRQSGELSLLAITEQAASVEAQVFREAFGAVEALGSIVGLYREDAAQCEAFFRAYAAANPTYRLAGFIGADGVMRCSSAGIALDFSGAPHFQEALADPRLRVRSVHLGQAGAQPVTVVTTPVFDGGALAGLVALSIPFETFAALQRPALPLSPLALVTYNGDGQPLFDKQGLAAGGPELPDGLPPGAFAGPDPKVLEARNKVGQRRIYVIRPIVRDTVFALSVWPEDSPFVQPSILARLAALVPVTMWLASLIVAFWALNRLAIRHISKLRRQMQRFALNRDLPRTTLGPGVPTELLEMEDTFLRMGESILKDEATLEDSLREKNILLKEVHHRVKNNLQLVSSIMNMQIRQAKTEDARRVLERLQERILGLATVHKNLYQNDDLVQVEAAVLLREVVNQLLSVGLAPGSNVTVDQRYAEVLLEADDAAPLTMLVSEALTNALKHVPQEQGGRIDIHLALVGAGEAELVVSNTKGAAPPEKGTELGFKLINAFARQLNGQFEVKECDKTYRLRVTFPVLGKVKPVQDF